MCILQRKSTVTSRLLKTNFHHSKLKKRFLSIVIVQKSLSEISSDFHVSDYVDSEK